MCGSLTQRNYRVLWLGFSVCLFALITVPAAWSSRSISERPIKRVLLLYSDNVRLPFAEIQDEVFRERLSGLPEDVQVFSENLDSSLFAGSPDHLLADFYRQKYRNVKFDVLIAAKPEALQFLIAHRTDVFGGAPIVFCNVSQREKLLDHLPPGVTGVSTDYSMLPALNMIQQIQPDIRRIEFIIGVAPREAQFMASNRAEIDSFSAKVPVEYWIGLTPDELKSKLAEAPEHSAAFYVSEAKDRLGRSFVPRDLLEQITPTSSIPVYSISTTYLGAGTIGGRLIDPKIDATMATELAERILSGENPETVTPLVEPHRYAFDSRALKRSHIAESRLPAESEVLYREVTPWVRNRYWILAGILFLLLETVLVAMLLVERRRGRQARSFLERRFAIERVVSESATRLSECPADRVNGEIERGLGELLESEKADRAGFFIIDDSGTSARSSFTVQQPGISERSDFYDRRELPWITKKLLSGRYVTVARLSDLPLQARADRTYLEQRGVRSLALIPSSHAGSRSVLVVARESENGEWPAALTGRLNVLGNVFANALARKEAQEAKRESDERFRYLFTEAPIGIALGDMEGKLLFANPSMCSMLGYTEEELRDRDRRQFADPDDEKKDWEQFRKMQAGLIRTYQIEKRYMRKDGTPMWGRLNVSTLNSPGHKPLVLATLEDITERRAALEELKRAHSELQQFAPRLISAQEDERRRISRELHDDIGQRLALLRIELDLVEQKMPFEGAAKREEIRIMLAQLDELVVDVHNLSHQLHSSKLQHLGLSAALREVCQQIASQHHIEIKLKTGPMPESLPEQISLCFYRVAQEGLANAVKHSGASRVDVSLTYERGVLRLRIRDFGIGFEPTVRGNGLGLVTMQERLKIIGGALRFHTVPDGGTELDAQASVDGTSASAQVA